MNLVGGCKKTKTCIVFFTFGSFGGDEPSPSDDSLFLFSGLSSSRSSTTSSRPLLDPGGLNGVYGGRYEGKQWL